MGKSGLFPAAVDNFNRPGISLSRSLRLLRKNMRFTKMLVQVCAVWIRATSKGTHCTEGKKKKKNFSLALSVLASVSAPSFYDC